MKITMDLIEDIHANAVAHGWWESERPWHELTSLIMSELSEALEALRHGNPESVKTPGFSMHEEETADALIRVLDLAGWMCGRYRRGRALLVAALPSAIDYARFSKLDGMSAWTIADVEAQVTRLYHSADSVVSRVASAVAMVGAILDYADYHNLRLAEAVQAKHEYNKSRPYKHGKEF